MKPAKIALCAIAILLTGCHNEKREKEQAKFFPDWKKSSVNYYQTAQAADGARCDGMLYERHFDGMQVNSLGRQKLCLMLGADTQCKPLMVYMVHCGEGDLLNKREAAVLEFMKDGLRPDESVQFAIGPNPKANYPAAVGLADKAKADQAQTNTVGSEQSAAVAAPSPMK